METTKTQVVELGRATHLTLGMGNDVSEGAGRRAMSPAPMAKNEIIELGIATEITLGGSGGSTEQSGRPYRGSIYH